MVALYVLPRTCLCGKSGGNYIDHRRVVVNGPSIVLGINNNELNDALVGNNNISEFMGFVIPDTSNSVRRSG